MYNRRYKMIVEPVRVINVDNRTYDVASLPQQCQTLVAFYNEWRQKEADLKSELLLTQAAVREISREIVQTIQVEEAKKVAPAAGPGAEDALPEAAPAVETDQGPKGE